MGSLVTHVSADLEKHTPFISARGATSLLLAAGLLCAIAEVARHTGIDFGPVLGLLPVFLAVAIVLLLILAIAVGSLRRRRALACERAGLCVRCQFDLRGGSNDRCPRCGMPVLRRRHPVTGQPLD